MEFNVNVAHREPWNKGKIVGQKAPFKVKDIWALRVRLHTVRRDEIPAFSRASRPSNRSQTAPRGGRRRKPSSRPSRLRATRCTTTGIARAISPRQAPGGRGDPSREPEGRA